MMKCFPGMTYQYILWEISYANVAMLAATLPKVEDENEEENEEEKEKPVDFSDSVVGLSDYLKNVK